MQSFRGAESLFTESQQYQENDRNSRYYKSHLWAT